VADRSLCLLPTDITGRQRSAIYGSADHDDCSGGGGSGGHGQNSVYGAVIMSQPL